MAFDAFLSGASDFSRRQVKNKSNLRRLQFLASLIAIILLFGTAAHLSNEGKLSKESLQGLWHAEKGAEDGQSVVEGEPKSAASTPVAEPIPGTQESEKGTHNVGEHVHVQYQPATPPNSGVKGCEYPILIHVTPDPHCTGALALYGSIVRNVLNQPNALQGKVCVHFTFVDPELKTFEEMYKWRERDNPFTYVHDCAYINEIPEYNNVVPVRWNALPPIEKPDFMEAGLVAWLAALNKVHSWGFDLYPRILILDADSIIITDLAKIFQETPAELTISAPPDQFVNCHDRARLNGGMVLLRPSRYFHIVATELLYDQSASCQSGKWSQSEQELLNCICGNIYGHEALRPEFKCSVMPMYNSIWPKNYGCSDAQAVAWRSIHYTAAPKPWTIKEGDFERRLDYTFWKCVRDLTRKGSVDGLTNCQLPGPEAMRHAGNFDGVTFLDG